MSDIEIVFEELQAAELACKEDYNYITLAKLGAKLQEATKITKSVDEYEALRFYNEWLAIKAVA